MSGKERSRTVTDVLKTLEQAKISADSLHPSTQVLKFSNSEKKYICLELNKELLEAIESGKSMVIRGKKSDSAVLCTDNKTFDLKESETSNSLLILRQMNFPAEVDSSEEKKVQIREVCQLVHTYLEPRACKPHFRSLLRLLVQRLYKGPEFEDDDDEPLTTNDLLNEVQASEEELLTELNQLLAVQVNGSWKLLDCNYQFKILSQFLQYFEEHGIPLNKLQMEKTCQEFQDTVDLSVLQQVFLWYTTPVEMEENGKELLYQLNEDRVCRSVAEAILRPAHKFPLADFLNIWQESVPEGLKTDIKQLNGIAIVEKNSSPPCIWHFPEQELPDDINGRLHKLFQQRSAWPLDDIMPYMERISSPDMPGKAILAKYARMSTKDGVKYITGRHSK